MRLASLVALVVCSGAAQERKLDCKVRRLDVTGAGTQWNVDLVLEHTFPDKSIFAVTVKMKQHQYNWVSKEFTFGTEGVGFVKPVMIPARGKIASTPRRDVLTLSSAGIYELIVAFDPVYQNQDSVRREIYEKVSKYEWYRKEFPAFVFYAGDLKKILQELREDTEDCVEMIKKASAFLNRIERESEEKDWEKRSQGLFQEIEKLKASVEKKSATSLHSAAYRMIVGVLEQLIKIGQQAAMMKKAETTGTGDGGGGGDDDDDPPQTHPKENLDAPMSRGMDGRPLSLKRMRAHIVLCDVVRIREYYSWLTILHEIALDRIDAAYGSAKKNEPDAGKAFQKARNETAEANEEIQKSFKSMLDSSSKEKFEPWTVYPFEEKDRKYADFFAMVREYVKMLQADAETAGDEPATVVETRAKLRAHHQAARTRAMGKKKAP